jgi:hypothetical protein
MTLVPTDARGGSLAVLPVEEGAAWRGMVMGSLGEGC